MWDQARKWIGKRPFGPIVATLLLAALAWTLIWTVIEPLSIPDEIAFTLPRWAAHALLAALLGSFGAMVLALWATDNASKTPPLFDFQYTVSQSPEFYERVANKYDSRNSPSLLATHNKVVELVRDEITLKPSARVLDLGGGTGLGIARQFFDSKTISWRYVDNSSRMVSIFRSNFNGTKLNPQAEFSDIADYLKNSKDTYDIIILSLVLTSLSYRPDWAKLVNMLSPGGKLIIADIDAAYTARHPYYVIEVDGRRHALEPDPLPLTQLIHEIRSPDISIDHVYPIKEGSQNYSFVISFLKS